MEKIICVINGKGGIGKDTLIDAVKKNERNYVYNISAIEPIKEILEDVTKGSDKNLAQRKLLADIRKVVDDYYESEHGIPYTRAYLKRGVRLFAADCETWGKSYDRCIMFVHIREPQNIAAFLEMANSELSLLRDEDMKLASLLVQSDRAQESYGNDADDLVDEYNYDFTYTSKGDIEEDGQSFREFFEDIITDGKYEFYLRSVSCENSREKFVVGRIGDKELYGTCTKNRYGYDIDKNARTEDGQFCVKLSKTVSDMILGQFLLKEMEDKKRSETQMNR